MRREERPRSSVGTRINKVSFRRGTRRNLARFHPIQDFSHDTLSGRVLHCQFCLSKIIKSFLMHSTTSINETQSSYLSQFGKFFVVVARSATTTNTPIFLFLLLSLLTRKLIRTSTVTPRIPPQLYIGFSGRLFDNKSVLKILLLCSETGANPYN